MKKRKVILIIITVILIILLLPLRKDMLWDGGSVEYKAILYKFTKVHRLANNGGYYEGVEIDFLGIKIFDNTKIVDNVILKVCKETPEGINERITNYFKDSNSLSSNMAHWYVDEKSGKVIVGMIDISNTKQDEFINTIFDYCGGDYINFIKENSVIQFEESKGIFTGEIIEFKNNSILVKVIKEEVGSINSDKVYVVGKDIDKLAAGNKVRIIYNGMVLTSDPPQVGAAKIELIK